MIERIPVNPAEARELREQAAANPDDDGAGHRGCIDGWLGEDNEGRPRPCLVCRSHLRRGHTRPR